MVKRLRHRPFTAVTRVRFPLESCSLGIVVRVEAPILAKPICIATSAKMLRFGSHIFADVAQLAEQLICNQQVIGSSPIIGLTMISSINIALCADL